MKSRLLLSGILAFVISTPWATKVRAEDWRGFRGANGDSTSDGRGVFGKTGAVSLGVTWKHKIGSGYSSVSVADGVAINLFSDPTSDFAGAFDATSGKELWRSRLADRYPGRWGSKDGPISTPLIDRGRVFVLDPAGHFYCLDFKTGKRIWDTNLPKAHGSTEPFYGFASSPLLVGDAVVLQIGGPKGSTVAAFDVTSGKVLWKSGPEDVVNYQSASLVNVAGKPVLIGLGDKIMSGHDPRTGQIYWTMEYGDGSDIGSKTSQIVKTTGNRFFVNGRSSDSTLYELSETDVTAPPKEVWKTRHIKNTYVIPVYHDGLLFGYNGRILACVDAGTGELVWRSREPGDGFPILVDGHLVIATKEGHLSIAPASRKGYEEVANIPVAVDDLVWSPATFVNKSLYVRSIESWARVDIRPATTAAGPEEEARGVFPNSEFGRFVARVEAAEHKQPLIDAFLASHATLPVVEGKDMVHFVYHGPGKDISMSSDLFGERYDRPLNRIEGTQFFYYSTRLEPDARLPYGFIRDFDEYLGDPANPNKQEGKVALLSMPDFKEPDFLRDPATPSRGRVEEVILASKQFGESLAIKVYLPNGYDESRSYPVLYVLSGNTAIKEGRVIEALDNLLGKSVEPLIAAFVPDPGERPGGRFNSRKSYLELAGDGKDKTRLMLVEELMPLIESRYRIERKAERRSLMGLEDAAYASFYATLKHPELFGGLGLLSINWEPGYRDVNTALLKTPSQQPLRIFLEWGKYDSRSPREGWDAVEGGRAFSATLRSKGYTFVGGETHEGAGWFARRNRLNLLLETIFPM